MEINKNTGFIEGQRATDYILGANSPIEFESRNTNRNWIEFLGMREDQRFRRFDTMACVTYSALNSVEAQINWMLKNGLVPNITKDWLIANGYLKNGLFEASDRFTAKMSETTGRGNFFYKVWDSIRNDGLVPEYKWPTSQDFDWNEYYKEIPEGVKNLGREFLNHFNIRYEFVSVENPGDSLKLDKELEHAPIQISVKTCYPWDAHVQACSGAPNHAILLCDIKNDEYKIFDHYNPYEKTLDNAYYIGSAVKGIVTPIAKDPLPEGLVQFDKDLKYWDFGEDIKKLRDALNMFGWKNKGGDLYDSELCDVVFRFQLGNLSHTWLEMLLSLKGRRVGPRTRAIINKMLKHRYESTN